MAVASTIIIVMVFNVASGSNGNSNGKCKVAMAIATVIVTQNNRYDNGLGNRKGDCNSIVNTAMACLRGNGNGFKLNSTVLIYKTFLQFRTCILGNKRNRRFTSM